MHSPALESTALRAQAEQIADAYLNHPPRPGAPSLLGDPEKVQLFLASIRDGNYRETAIKQAGIAKQTFYNWLKLAEHGDEGAKRFVDALEKAEADAEADTVRNVRNASKLPQFWAAGMTWLERKSPDRWGKRQDDQSVPKVVVQIGVKDSDVNISLLSPTAPQQLACANPSQVDIPCLINSDYVNQPAELNQALPALEPQGGPTRQGRPLSGRRGVGQSKRRVGGRGKEKRDG